MLFSFNLGLFRAFFFEKLIVKKLAKSKANPLPKCQILTKNGPFLTKFFSGKQCL